MNRRVNKKQTTKSPSLLSRVSSKFNQKGKVAEQQKAQPETKPIASSNQPSLLQRCRAKLSTMTEKSKPVKRNRHTREVNFSNQSFNSVDDVFSADELVTDDTFIVDEPVDTSINQSPSTSAFDESTTITSKSTDTNTLVSKTINSENEYKSESELEPTADTVDLKSSHLGAKALATNNIKASLANKKSKIKLLCQQRKVQVKKRWAKLPLLHRRIIIVLAPVLIVLMFLPSTKSAREQLEQPIYTSGERVSINLNTQSLSDKHKTNTPVLADNNVPTNPQVSTVWQSYKIKTGDTLAKVFRAHGLSMRELNLLVKIEGEEKPLSQIKRGQIMRFKLTKQGQLDMLQLEQLSSDQDAVMFFRLSDGTFGRNK